MGSFAVHKPAQSPESSRPSMRDAASRQAGPRHPTTQRPGRRIGKPAALRTPSSTWAVIQAKLMIDRPGDVHEQEANRTAEQVMEIPEPSVAASARSGSAAPVGCECGKTCSDCQNEHADADEVTLHMKPAGLAGARPAEAPSIVHDALRSPGQLLDQPSRAYFEPRLGHDFSAVRIHTGPQAVASANAVQAHAYTVGHDVVFGAGRFAPGTLEGRRLLAHELAHVVQQSAASGPDAMLTRQPAEADVGEEEGGEEEADEEFGRVLIRVRPPANNNAPVREGRGARGWRPDPDFDPALKYPDQGSHTDWHRAYALDAVQRQEAVLRYQLESTPLATVEPGGEPPNFVTFRTYMVRPLSSGEKLAFDELASIRFQPRLFHLPDAMEHDLGLADTPDEYEGVILEYFPELNRGGFPTAQLRGGQPGAALPRDYHLPGGPIYHPRLPAGAAIGDMVPDFDQAPLGPRLRVFQAAEQRTRQRKAVLERQRARAALLAEAEELTLGGRKKREGPCLARRTYPMSSGTRESDRHNAYAAHVAGQLGYSRIRAGKTELTWQTPEGVSNAFDTFNPLNLKEVWEVKTQHEWTSPLGMATAPYRVKGGFHERVIGLEVQRLKGLYVAARCGLRFRYAVDSPGMAVGLNQTWLGLPPVVYIPDR